MGGAVLGIVQVEDGHPLVDADGDGGDLGGQGVTLQLTPIHELLQRIPQGHPGTTDGRGAGAAIGLDDVAIQGQGALPQGLEVHRLAQGAADEALDLQGATPLLALGRLAGGALAGGAGQHAVLRRDPAAALTLEKGRDPLLDAGGAQHAGVAELSEDRTLGVTGETPGKAQVAHLVGAAQGWTHGGDSAGGGMG